jgi:DNA-binding NarL/FixJ family response regulator
VGRQKTTRTRSKPCAPRPIAGALYLAPKTVEANIHRVLQKLDISESPDSNRRVLAVLTYLRSA